MGTKPDTQMQSKTSPWTDVYATQNGDGEAMTAHGSHMAQQEEIAPTHDALEDVYNSDYAQQTYPGRV